MKTPSVEGIREQQPHAGRSLWSVVSRFFNLAVGAICVGVNMILLNLNPNNDGAAIGLVLGMISFMCSPQFRAALARTLRQMADSLSD